MAIHNMKELEKVVNKYIIKALELTRDEIFEVVSRKVSDYYNEDDNTFYIAIFFSECVYIILTICILFHDNFSHKMSYT